MCFEDDFGIWKICNLKINFVLDIGLVGIEKRMKIWKNSNVECNLWIDNR